ncbi:transcription factor-like 5 protein isoform X2 [Sparus aurata]|uniref:transcription factor-like 5 protein isoform X2 n=1 Tax=Sparus aurata TaxID=8175 RepID=UPI0011C17521|nr:transcription factor-like 5 protein isoform X2 [Sparus aurata]
MSSWSSAGKAIYLSPSHGVILSQGGCLTHNRDQTLGNELGLMEMSEFEYTHLQHLFQAHVEAHAAPPDGPDPSSPPATVMVKDANGSTVISPFTTTTQAIDLSTSTEEHCLVLPAEKTPASYGEVPGFVLARVRDEDSLTELHTKSSISSQNRSRSAARVCLEKRFNTVSTESPRQQDIQSAALSKFLTTLQQSAEAQEAAMYPQMQKWMKSDRANPSEVSNPFVGGVFNPVTNMCEQVIGHIPHMVEPKHQCLILPKSFPFNFHPEKVVTAHYSSGSNSTQEQQLVNIETVATPHGNTKSLRRNKSSKASPDSAGEPGSSTKKRARAGMSLSQRREKHNRKERERRKRIRLCCDELNMLVPFCDSDSDKVTTLQWTTAFFRYINNTYGDTFKEEFKKAFTDEKGLILKPCPSSHQDLIPQAMDETLDIPLMVEQ